MVAPVYTTDLTTFWLEGSTTVTAIGSGGAGLGNPETDFFIQGSDCISKAAWTNAVKGFIIDGLAAIFTVPTDGCIIMFAKYDAQGSLDTQAGGGLRMIIGSANNAYDEFYCAGSDTIEFDSWIPYAIDPNVATPDVANSGGAERWVGVLADLPTTSGPTKGSPIAADSIRYGRGEVRYTIGDSGDPANFSGAEAVGNVNGTRWGLLELQKGSFQTQGFHSIGLAGTAVYFSDADKILFWRKQLNCLTDDAVSTAFNRVEILNSGTTCIWDNIIWSALGTRSKGTFVHTAGSVTLTSCQFYDWDTFTFLAAAIVTNTIFSRCGLITAPASTLTGSSILNSTVAADTGALSYDSATNTDGKLDDMTFEMSATLHHAIDFGTSVTGNITLRGIEFTGFGATDDSNDSTVRFLATSGSLTLSLVDCTVDGVPASSSNFSVDDAAGIAVTVSIDPVDLTITVKDKITLALLQNVQTSIYLKDSPFTELMNEDTNVSGVATESYSGSLPVDIVWKTRKSEDTDNPRYKAGSGVATVTTAGFTLDVLMEENPVLN